jgi:hypothetical protein
LNDDWRWEVQSDKAGVDNSGRLRQRSPSTNEFVQAFELLPPFPSAFFAQLTFHRFSTAQSPLRHQNSSYFPPLPYLSLSAQLVWLTFPKTVLAGSGTFISTSSSSKKNLVSQNHVNRQQEVLFQKKN